MRYYIQISLLFLLFIVVPATKVKAQPVASAQNAHEIKFIENSWPEAVRQARAQHRYIFMDTYATWCGPCNMMKLITFKDAGAAAFFNEHFVNLSINIEKGIGPELAGRLGIQSIPTLIVFDENGKPVSGSTGYLSAKKLIRFGQQALAKQPL